jgi:hypothetical protein
MSPSQERNLALFLPVYPFESILQKNCKHSVTRDNAGKLAKQIVFDPSTAVEKSVTPYGTKFNQVIRIVGENGKTIDVDFAWIRNNDGVVRLVTAFPQR